MFLLILDTEEDIILTEQLYLKYKNLLYEVANDILQNNFDAEDALQQTMIRVMDHIKDIKDINSKQTRNYLCIICRNISLNIYNKKKNIEEIKDEMPDTNENFEAIIITKDMYNKLKDFIYTLDKKYQDVLFLKLNHELSSEEIAKILKIKPETVRKRLERGRKSIKKFLLKEGISHVR